MHTVQKGEIIFREKYGTSSRERVYVRPQDQRNVAVQEADRIIDFTNFFKRLFLPQGYPESVSKDYLGYQIWDTAQAFCSTITGIWATQEVLRGVGVGDQDATPLAATVTWVIKDGCGHVGKILFAYSHGSHLDAYSKKWRLYADLLNNAAMCIEVALPVFNNYNCTTFVLCVSTMMKAIVGIAGGATRAAMTQHHALRGNMADVSAKDSAQETAVNFVASFTALLMISLTGSNMFIFLLLMVLHMVFNYFAVRSVCLRTLNKPRFLQMIDTYLRKEVISSPCEVNKLEPIMFYYIGDDILDLKLSGFKIKVGMSVKKIIKQSNPTAAYLKKIQEIYKDNNYILLPDLRNRCMYVLVKEKADTDDILCGYFHAVLFSIIICAINDVPLTMFRNSLNPRPFAQICQTLQTVKWTRDCDDHRHYDRGLQVPPTIDVIKFVDQIIQKEWMRVRNGLIATGWDLHRQLLVSDEWRVPGGKVVPKPIPQDRFSSWQPTEIPTPGASAFSNVERDLGEENDVNYAHYMEAQPVNRPMSRKSKKEEARRAAKKRNASGKQD